MSNLQTRWDSRSSSCTGCDGADVGPAFAWADFEIRFTDAQIEEILALHTRPIPTRREAVVTSAVAGQTKLSAVRRR